MRVVTGAGDEQDVGVPGRGDDAEAEALEVVVRARVSVSSCSQPLHEPASTWRSARLRPRSGAASAIVAAEAAEVAEEGEHQRSAQA